MRSRTLQKEECESRQFATKKKENARNASKRQRKMRARDAREQRKDNEELTGKKGNSKKRDAGVGRGKRCNTVTRQVAFVNRKTMAPAGGESKGEGKRLAREGLRKCTFASE